MNRRSFIALTAGIGLTPFNGYSSIFENMHKLPIMQLLDNLNNSFPLSEMVSYGQIVAWVDTMPKELDANETIKYIKTCITNDYINNRVSFAENILLSRTEIMLFSLKSLNASRYRKL